MFKKLLASVGIGGATVDTILQTERLQPNTLFQADIVIRGGDTEQTLSGLELRLVTEAKRDGEDGYVWEPVVLDRWALRENMTLAVGEEVIIPFEATLPTETPITAIQAHQQQSHVWIETGLNIDRAIDASDKDYLDIAPTSVMHMVLSAMDHCGYELVKADVEVGYLNGATFSSHSGIYQELEFKPKGFGLFTKEVELSFICEDDHTHVLIEHDRRLGLGSDQYHSHSFNNQQSSMNSVLEQIKSLL